MPSSVGGRCFTDAVEASSGEPLFVYGVLDTCKATEPLFKTPHADASASMVPAAGVPILCSPLEWDVAHIVAEDEEAVGIMSLVFSPGGILCFPATQHPATAETLHLIPLP